MSEQLFLEAFNSEPYFFEKEEKYGAMDIIYTFEDEAGHGFKFHFEKKVALGKHAYVCVLSQKTPGLKTYKRVIGKFSNPMRTVATLLAVVRDIHDTRKDVHGIVMSIPEQAFGSYARLVKKIMTRELRTVLNVEDGEYTPEDFEKMGLVGIVTTVKPRNMNTVYTGPALKEYQERQAGKDGAGVSAPAAAVPDVKATSVSQTMPVQGAKSTKGLDEKLTQIRNKIFGKWVVKYSQEELNALTDDEFRERYESDKADMESEYNSIIAELTTIYNSLRLNADKMKVQDLADEAKSHYKTLGTKGKELQLLWFELAENKKRQSAQQPVVDPVAEKENFYFDYDHRQITLTFNDKETAGRIKDQLLELGAATFNGSEFFTNKEKLILVDDKSLDVKKVQETLFPILGNPLMINGVFVDPNIRSSVRSPDGVIYRIKGNTIQVEDAPKDSAMTIARELIPMADRIFDYKGSNTLELNEQGIADGFTMHNIAPVFKKSNISSRLSARLFRSWESAVTEASDKYDLSTGDFGSSFTNNSSYLIDAATSGVVGEYLRTDGNVISGIVLYTNYMIREAVAKPLRALGFTVEYDVQGWRTQVKLPVNSDYTIPGTSELAVFIKEVDNLANIDRKRSIVEYVGGNKNFRARWNPDGSRAFLILPTAESSGLGWRDYTAYATAPEYVRVDNIESYEQFLKLVEFVKNFDFGANLLRNIGVSKYLSDVRSGGATASKSYKLKDGGEVEISFKFGDKVMFAFNQASQGFDKDLSEWTDEKNEIFGRISAIALYKLGTADANKTLKNIDAWLDEHIVSKEDNASSAGLTLNADFSSGNDYSASIENGALQIHDEREGVVATLSGINLDGVPPIVLSGVELHIREPEFKKSSFQGVVVDKTISVDNVKFVIKKADGTLIGRIELNSGNKKPTRKEDNSSASVNIEMGLTRINKLKYEITANGKPVATIRGNLDGRSWMVNDPKSGIHLVNWPTYASLASAFDSRYLEFKRTGVKGDSKPVRYEDNSSKEANQSTEDLINQEIESKKSWAEDILRESLSHNTSGQTVAKVEYVGTSRPTKNHVLYIFKLLVQPKFGTPVAQKAFVKGTIGLDVVTGYSGTGQNRQPTIKPVSITLDRSVTSWVGYDYDPKVADQYEKTMTFAANTAAKPEKVKQSGTLEIVASLSNSIYTHYITVQDGSLTTMSENGSPRSEGFWRFAPKGMSYSDGEEFVKAEIMKMYDSGASNLAVKEKVNEWLKPKDGYVIDVRGDRTNRGVKDIKKNLISTLEKLKTEGESKKLTGVDLRAGVTRAYNGQTGRVEKLYSVEGQAEQISELYEQLRSVIAFSGMKGKFEVEFWNPDKKGSTKHKVSFTEGGASIPSSMLSEMGNYVRVTQSGINLTVAKDFDTSPEDVVNEFMSYVGISNWHYNIKKKDIKQALYLTFDINAIKAIGSVEVSSLNESTQIDEGIKEDLTGKAPNRVKRELLEATLQKLGLYRESFTYGNATFKTVMSECAVEIIPTSGNIRNFAKMLGARLGQELRIDDEGFLSFDLDNI